MARINLLAAPASLWNRFWFFGDGSGCNCGSWEYDLGMSWARRGWRIIVDRECI